MEEDVVFKESELSPTEPSESTDLRLSFTASLVAPISLTFPCRRVAPASGSSTTVAISFEGAAMEDVSGSLETMLHPKKSSRPCITAQVQQGGGATSTPSAISADVNASGGTASSGVSIEASPSVSKRNEVDNSPSLELEGRASSEQRWIAELLTTFRIRLDH